MHTGCIISTAAAGNSRGRAAHPGGGTHLTRGTPCLGMCSSTARLPAWRHCRASAGVSPAHQTRRRGRSCAQSRASLARSCRSRHADTRMHTQGAVICGTHTSTKKQKYKQPAGIQPLPSQLCSLQRRARPPVSMVATPSRSARSVTRVLSHWTTLKSWEPNAMPALLPRGSGSRAETSAQGRCSAAQAPKSSGVHANSR